MASTTIFPYTPMNNGVNIFLVEDNPGDVRLIQEAFKALDCEVSLHTITNGEEAMKFLTTEATTDLFPDFVLLDLNLPDRDGVAVLEAIRNDPQIEHLPMIMLTSSEAAEDIVRCYEANANAYLRKPTSPDELVSIVWAVESFWFKRVRFLSIPL